MSEPTLNNLPLTNGLPHVNQEVDRWDLEVHPRILAVVDCDGDVWTRDGDNWLWLPADGGLEARNDSEGLAAGYSPLRVAWVQR